MKQTVSLNDIISTLNKIGKGEFHHIEFYSEPKTTDGSKIFKIASATIRTKIDHTHCKAYTDPSYHRTEDSTYILADALKVNNKTGNTLLKVAPLWDTYKVTYEDENGNALTAEEAKARIKPSNHSSDEKPLIITVNASKVLDF